MYLRDSAMSFLKESVHRTRRNDMAESRRYIDVVGAKRDSQVLVESARKLADIGCVEEALLTCNQVVSLYSEWSELGIQQQVAQALFTKGATLEEVGRFDEAICVYDEIVKRYDSR